MNYDVYDMYRNKIYKNNSTKARSKETEVCY